MNNSIIIPSPINFSSIPSPASSKASFIPSGSIAPDVTKKLENFGYKITEYISIKKDNQKIFKYVKAIDPRGHTVMVELDTNNNASPSNLVTVESIPVNQVPSSLVNGMLNAAGNNVLGVCFECNNGYHLSTHTDDSEVSNKFLTILEKPTEKIANIGDSVLAIPVLRLEDIIENPTMVLQITSIATINIINASFEAFKSHLKSTDTQLKNLVGKADKVMGAMYVTMDTVIKSLGEYEKGREYFDDHPPLNPGAINEYQRIVFNIKKHREIIDNALKGGLALSDIRTHLNEISQVLEGIAGSLSS